MSFSLKWYLYKAMNEKMTYDIKLDNSEQEKGTIDFDRLAFLAEKIIKIAKGALQIRIGAISHKKGKPTKYLNNALKIKLTGIEKGSTILNCEAQTFSSTLPSIQIDAFRPEVAQELKSETPMSLFMKSYQEAFDDSNEEKYFLDKPLIRDLKDFKNFFNNNNEALIISNNNITPTLKLKKTDFDKIKQLEDTYPDSQNVVVNGIIDILEHSKSKVTIQTKQGKIFGTLNEPKLFEVVKDFWGSQATVYGIGHFKPNGSLNFIEVDRILRSTPDDRFFSKIPFAENTAQQIQRQIAKKPNKNWMNEIAGKWPGDESDEEFNQLLKELG